MSRYDQLQQLIGQAKPKHIVEVGTWNGDRAIQMATEALKHQKDVHYTGFDLFEDATAENDALELNVKAHFSAEDVAAKLEAFSADHPGFTYDLKVGNTRETLKEPLDKPDFVFLDGGHSVETIRSDLEHVKSAPIIAMDDFYTPDEDGRCPDIEKFGCNKVIEGLEFTLLPAKDRVRDGGLVQIAVLGQVKMQIKIVTKNCVPDSQIHANIRYAATLMPKWLEECAPHSGTAVLCSGGPTLKDHLEEIRNLGPDHYVFCVKHSHDTLIEAGIVPFGCFLLDPRPHTKDFIEHPHPEVHYLVASMCHPSTLDVLLGHKVIGYNALVGAGEKEVMGAFVSKIGKNDCVPFIAGGSTSAMRGVFVLHALGFRKVKMYGFDSCYAEDVGRKTSGATPKECVRIDHRGREFWTDHELMAQVQDFEALMPLGLMEIEVVGDGMIAHSYQCMRRLKPDFKEWIDAS